MEGTASSMSSSSTRSRHIPFAALIAANAVSMHGNALAAIAIPWFVLEATGSAARTGVVAFAGLAPYVLGSFLGGVVVDRMGFRRASVVADLASMLSVALIPLLHALDLLSFPLLVLLVLAGALLDTPGSTARAALLPNVARLAGLRLERANAIHEVIESGAQFGGPSG
jgi:MFS family permease